jgi:predicted unusual protein kinase regulating ubiquinone biosynthesis (AarF/ABC1/UbiB family)
MLRDTPEVHVPSPVPELTTKRLLTMTWLEGRSILTRLEEEPPLEERNAYAKALFNAWYVPLYRYGVIHGDPHLGNYQVRPPGMENGGGINLLDFGAIRVFPPRFITGTLTLYEAVRDEDRDKAAHAFELWGFKDLKRETMEVLLRWARFLYEPLLEDRVRAVQETNDPQYGRKVAEEVHKGLKAVGGVRPPREFVLMDRAAVGLGSVFLRLKAELNWHDMFHQLIDDYREEDLRARQAAALAEAGVPPTVTPAV